MKIKTYYKFWTYYKTINNYLQNKPYKRNFFKIPNLLLLVSTKIMFLLSILVLFKNPFDKKCKP